MACEDIITCTLEINLKPVQASCLSDIPHVVINMKTILDMQEIYFVFPVGLMF